MDEPKSNDRMGMVIFFGVLLLIAGLGVGTWYAISHSTSPTTNADKVAESQSTAPDINQPYTMQQVAEHAAPTKCWIVFNGKIYNVTNYLKDKPEAVDIIESCGQDATARIQGKSYPTGEKDAGGTPVSAPAETILAKLQIGRLKQ